MLFFAKRKCKIFTTHIVNHGRPNGTRIVSVLKSQKCGTPCPEAFYNTIRVHSFKVNDFTTVFRVTERKEKEKSAMEGEEGESSDGAGSEGDSNDSEEENEGGAGGGRVRADDASGLNRTLAPARVRERGVRAAKSAARAARVYIRRWPAFLATATKFGLTESNSKGHSVQSFGMIVRHGHVSSEQRATGRPRGSGEAGKLNDVLVAVTGQRCEDLPPRTIVRDIRRWARQSRLFELENRQVLAHMLGPDQQEAWGAIIEGCGLSVKDSHEALVFFRRGHRVSIESNPCAESSSCNWGTSVLACVLKIRKDKPAVVLIWCHDQDSITQSRPRQSGRDSVNSIMSRCKFLGGGDAEDEEDYSMVTDFTYGFKFFGNKEEVRSHAQEPSRNTSFPTSMIDNTTALISLVGTQTLESRCRNGGQSSPSVSSASHTYDSPAVEGSNSEVRSSQSHSNISEASPPSVNASPETTHHPVQHFRAAEDSPAASQIARSLDTSMICLASVDVDGMELDE